MTATTFKARLESRRELAPDVFELNFKLIEPTKLDYKAGQFVAIKVLDNKEPPVVRAYTFASSPTRGQDQFQLCFKVFRTEDGQIGRGSGWLSTVAEGIELEFFAPRDTLPFHDDAANTMLLLGTGTGIAPLKAMVEHLTDTGSTKKLHLYLGVRYPEDLFYQEEFEALKNQNSNFDYTLAVSRPPEGYTGATGRLPEVLVRDFAKGISTQTAAYICGSTASVAGIKAKLLELGMPAELLHAEGYR